MSAARITELMNLLIARPEINRGDVLLHFCGGLSVLDPPDRIVAALERAVEDAERESVGGVVMTWDAPTYDTARRYPSLRDAADRVRAALDAQPPELAQIMEDRDAAARAVADTVAGLDPRTLPLSIATALTEYRRLTALEAGIEGAAS